MVDDCRYRILGALEMDNNGSIVPIPAAKQWIILASLLSRAGSMVSVETLVNRLWENRVPSSPVAALHVHISRLRQALGSTAVIVWRPDGYLIDVPPGTLDLHRQAGLVNRAHKLADTAPGEALTSIRQAARLWRGPILADVPSASLHAEEVPQLTERCLRAAMLRFDLELAHGFHEQILPELTGLVARFPFHERVRERLMLALYRCGRRAEALETYRAGAGIIRHDLGIEPGPGLRDLQLAILNDAVKPATGRPRKSCETTTQAQWDIVLTAVN